MTGIIFLLNITYCPYIYKYIDVLNQAGEDFEVIYWDRMNQPDACPKWKTHTFDLHSELVKNRILKMKDFIKFRRFVENVITKQKYDRLIVLTTLAGIFMADLLTSKYQGKYILDIRDYTFDRLPIFRQIERKLIGCSAFTAISSEGFKHFLPRGYAYVAAHNFMYSDIEAAKSFNRSVWDHEKPINLGYIGSIRHLELDCQLVKLFGCDSRFSLGYHGDGPTYLQFKDYCSKSMFNVKFTGRFTRNDKPKLLTGIDIINAYFSEDSFTNRYLLPNRFYDSIIYKVPILANSEVYCGRMVRVKKVGIAVNLGHGSICDSVYEEFARFNYELFFESCEKALEEILDDDKKYCERIASFARG